MENSKKKSLEEVVLLHKLAGQRKDAFRVESAESIPEFLRDTVVFDGKEVSLVCVEGTEKVPKGSVIGFEKSNQTSTGWNAWCIGNARESLVEIDGVFYKKAMVVRAQKISEVFPEFLRGAKIRRNPDGSWTIKTSWGESTGFPGKAYWVLYGRNGENVDANILTKSEASYKEYIVCDENGNDLGYLSEIDPA